MIPVSTAEVLIEVEGERRNQDAKWGEQNHSHAYWLAILTEEVGETATEVMHDDDWWADKLRAELIQVAAVAVAWIEAIDRRRP